jgi:hypothetical protein
MAFQKILWTLWLQGWENAPAIIKACLASWRRHHPDWTIVELNAETLADWVDLDEILPNGKWKNLPPAGLSDIVRSELLATYGGVWVDSSLYCTRPLEEWLPHNIPNGFFAFSRPGVDRLLASWFIATIPDHYLMHEWRRRVRLFWQDREECAEYFWFHHLFGQAYEENSEFRRLWDEVPKIAADGPHFFYPFEERSQAPVGLKDLFAVEQRTSPVFKLSHSVSDAAPPGSVMAYFLKRWLADDHEQKPIASQRGPVGSGLTAAVLRESATDTGRPDSVIKKLLAPEWKTAELAVRLIKTLRKQFRRRDCKRVLVLWYGALGGHGTIGDLLSAQAVGNALLAAGYQVDSASAKSFPGLAGRIVDWKRAVPGEYLAVVFVCGPMMKNHPEINALIQRFRKKITIGIGVSFFPHGHFNYVNPFDAAFAREGGLLHFADVAISAPSELRVHRSGTFTIGVVLRGAQAEYGVDHCLNNETQAMVSEAAEVLVSARGGRVITIENHLLRSGVESSEIEKAYAQCDLVFTSRFHGAVLALRQQVPFVAIDQIRSGGKVSRLLGSDWPFVYRAENASAETLVGAAEAVMTLEGRGLLRLARDKALRESEASLRALCSSLDTLVRLSR